MELRVSNVGGIISLNPVPEGSRIPLTLRELNPSSNATMGRCASPKFIEEQLQILRLTTPKLRYAWGPVRSG